MPRSTKRWSAVVHYRSDSGLVEVPHDIEELAELQDLVERGPDWNAIERHRGHAAAAQ